MFDFQQEDSTLNNYQNKAKQSKATKGSALGCSYENTLDNVLMKSDV